MWLAYENVNDLKLAYESSKPGNEGQQKDFLTETSMRQDQHGLHTGQSIIEKV